MNRLVDALLARRDLVDLAARRGRASFDLLLDGLGVDLLDGDEREVIEKDHRLLRRLRAGYLPLIAAPDWDGAVSLASSDGADGAGWWTVMVPATTGGVGLTVPQDRSEARLVALFVGPPESAGTVAYNPTAGSVMDLTLGSHCGPPSRGVCAIGTCGGCRPIRVWDPAAGVGIECRCPDQAN